MNRPHFAGLLLGTLLLGVTFTLTVQHVRAAGIPQTNALTYSGYLAGVDGTPVNTPQPINLYAYNAAAGGSPLCQVVPGTPTSVVSGRFQILLPPECTEVVKQNPDLWIEVHVGGIPVGRTKLGAVPYSVEAGHAMSANSANTAASAAVAQTIAPGPIAVGMQLYVEEGTSLGPICAKVPNYSAVVDCTCPTGTFVVSGGGWTVNAIRESAPASTTTWRTICSSSTGDVLCAGYKILCSRLSP